MIRYLTLILIGYFDVIDSHNGSVFDRAPDFYYDNLQNGLGFGNHPVSDKLSKPDTHQNFSDSLPRSEK